MFKYFLNLLFPHKCISCSSIVEEAGFCGACWDRLNFITGSKCQICSFPFQYEMSSLMICAKCIESKPKYDKAAALLVYDEYSKVLVHKLKYLDHTELAFLVAKWLYARHKEFVDSCDIIVPVPLHKKRLFKRKYNQALLIAKGLASSSGVELCHDLLIKKRHTIPQTDLSKEQREKNLRGAIVVSPKYKTKIIGKKLLIVDDVITTGSTVNLCAKILKKNHADFVGVVAIAKTIL